MRCLRTSLVSVLAWALLSVLAIAQIAPEIVENYDRFTDKTTVTVRSTPPIGIPTIDLEVAFVVSAKGKAISGATDFVMYLVSRNFEWKYLQCHGVVFIADGQRMSGLQTIHDGKVTTTGGAMRVNETVAVILTKANAKQLAQAKSVEVQLCKTEFALAQAQIRAIRDVVGRVP